MSSATKITLSDKELSLVINAEWILTKQIIIDKVYHLFAEAIPVIRSQVLNERALFPAEVISSVPKIYKGENYLQLPYVMLDYPRCFNKENIFAVRTMFWWANFFSITLHVSGYHVNVVRENLLKNRELIGSEFFIGVNENQWEHHFEVNNFLPCGQLNKEQQIKLFEQNDFIKLALKFDLHEWNNIPALLHEGYKKIAALIS
ncbi:MAG: hypothetical protein ABI741_16150 [Ferruginibacter sp.]